MASGIYLLYWEQDDSKVYIGKSISIDRRYKQHLNDFKNNIGHNIKLKHMYSLYGVPKMIELEVCTSNILNELEKYWIKEFNSIIDGYNLTAGGDGAGVGELHYKAKFSNSTISEAFLLLCAGITYSKIFIKTKVPLSILNNISKGRSHGWLSDIYPNKYKRLINTDRIGISRGFKRTYGN